MWGSKVLEPRPVWYLPQVTLMLEIRFRAFWAANRVVPGLLPWS